MRESELEYRTKKIIEELRTKLWVDIDPNSISFENRRTCGAWREGFENDHRIDEYGQILDVFAVNPRDSKKYKVGELIANPWDDGDYKGINQRWESGYGYAFYFMYPDLQAKFPWFEE